MPKSDKTLNNTDNQDNLPAIPEPIKYNLQTRPPLFENPEDMAKEIEKYFITCDKGQIEQSIIKGKLTTTLIPIPKTIEGLCLAIGFKARSSFYDYMERNKHSNDTIKAEFAYMLSRARLLIGNNRLTESLLGNQDGKIAALDLQTNHGYAQRKEIDTRSIMITITDKDLDKRLERTLKRIGEPVVEAEFE